MASSTPNINLTLPIGSEKVSRQIINDNNTKIDDAIGALPSGQNLQGEIDALNNKIDSVGFEIPQGTWSEVVAKYSVLVAVAKGTVNGNDVALSIMIPTAAIDNSTRLWVVTDAYNNTTAIHFQVAASRTTYTESLNYGAGSVAGATYEWYGF